MKYFTSCCVVLSLVALQTSAAVIDAVTLNGKTYTCPNEDTTITALTVTGGSSGNVVGVPAGVSLSCRRQAERTWDRGLLRDDGRLESVYADDEQ